MRMTVEVYAGIRRHLDHHLAAIQHGQFEVRRSLDMAEFARVRRTFDGKVHPSLDPAESVIAEGDGQWVAVLQPGRPEPVACIATRLYHGRLDHLFQSRRVWGDRALPVAGEAPIDLRWPDEAYELAGRLMLCGGLINGPETQGHKIGCHLVRYAVAASLLYWDFDVLWAMHKRDKIDSGVAGSLFGYEHHSVSFDRPPGRGPANAEEWLSWKTRAELLALYAGPVPAMVRAAA